jgi:hypothetical protein
MREHCFKPQDPVFDLQSGDFEEWFLRNEDYAQTAKRFAERFFPEQIHIVKRTLERVRDRAII